MKAYQIEKDAGIDLSHNTFSYCIKAEVPDSDEKKVLAAIEDKAKASIQDSDLYYTKSVLVTSSWNKNDDIFDPAEMWRARSTPIHKPTNLDHKDSQIVGHIISAWGVNEDGTIISDVTSEKDLPKTFHIVNGAVIYKDYFHEDEEAKARVEKLIEDIEAGEKYVSMECTFQSFDYMAKSEDGTLKIIERSEATAHLTKYLKCYGGTGMYENYQIGRILRKITFSGKGYVDHPANPDSIIFEDAVPIDFSAAKLENPFKQESGVSILIDNNQTRETIMADKLEAQVVAKDPEVDRLRGEIDKLKDQLAKAGVEQLQSDIEELKTQAAELKVMLDTSHIDLAKAKADFTASDEKVAKLDVELATAKDELKAIAKQALTIDRVSNLVDHGVDKEEAEANVALFENFTDEQFKAVADEMIMRVKAQANVVAETETEAEVVEAEVVEDDDEVADDDTADAAVLEDAEVDEDISLTASASDEDVEGAKAAITSEMSTLFGLTK